MESKHLTFPTQAPVITLTHSTEVEVPPGSWIYAVLPQAGENEFTFHLRHPESQILVKGIVKAKKGTPILKTTVIHHTCFTKAETLIRTLSEGEAAPRYTGCIRMEKTAQQSESYLNHHSLLIGEKAESWTTPSLEILANEVKCSHAATIRTLSDEDLFYAESRGIPRTLSQKMLIHAFLSDAKI